MVPMELDGFNVCSFSGDNAWMIFDEVATDCDSGSFGIFLLRADGANNLWKGDCSALGNLVLVDEEDCVGSFDSVACALCQTAKLVGCRSKPVVTVVWVLDWVSAFHLLASDVVCHRQTVVLSQFACFSFVSKECNCL